MGNLYRILALDVGDVRIGIAISDLLGITAQALETYKRTTSTKDLAYIAALVDKHSIDRLVLGLPLHMNGTIGEQAKKVETFADSLRSVVPVPIVLWDERLSTKLAQGVLLEANMSRKKRKQVVDKVAATYILQSYLDAGKHKEDIQ